MRIKKAHFPRSFAMLSAAAISLTSADAKTWVDGTGKHKIDAEFVSLSDGEVTLKSPDGRLITLPLERLSAGDQAFAKAQATEAEPPTAADPGEMKVTATARVQEWSDHADFKVEVDLVGGAAATAYSLGPVKADPITVGGKKIEPKRPFGRRGFKLVNRDQRFGIGHPENGVRVSVEYKVPKGTESVGKVAGSVKALAGGTAKEVALKAPLTRPDGPIKDPILTAMGAKADFKRKPTDEGGLQLEVSTDSESFVRLELIDADGKPLENVGRASFLSGGAMTYAVTSSKEALETAILKLHFREGAKEIELPFTLGSVEVPR